MSDEKFLRTALIIGEENLKKLHTKKVWIFGCGGVGSFTVEALCRAGVGNIFVVDMDNVDKTNINRQLIALNSTVGESKVSVMEKRCRDINPEVNFVGVKKMFSKDTVDEFDFSDADYIVDAIDMVSSKLLLVEMAKECNIPIICSMGTGNKLDATKICVSDVYSTHGDALARVMRHELKKRGIEKLKVVYSPEKAIGKKVCEDGKTRPITASVPWVPSVAGLVIAGEVVKDMLQY